MTEGFLPCQREAVWCTGAHVSSTRHPIAGSVALSLVTSRGCWWEHNPICHVNQECLRVHRSRLSGPRATVMSIGGTSAYDFVSRQAMLQVWKGPLGIAIRVDVSRRSFQLFVGGREREGATGRVHTILQGESVFTHKIFNNDSHSSRNADTITRKEGRPSQHRAVCAAHWVLTRRNERPTECPAARDRKHPEPPLPPRKK